MKMMLEKIKGTLNEKHDYSKFSVKKSLMSKMTCFVVGVVITIILLAWILNKVLFPSYYEEYKVEQVLSLYEELDKAAYNVDSKLSDGDKYTDKHLSNVFKDGSEANDCLGKIDKYGFEVYIFELKMNNLEALNINGDKKKTIAEIDKHRRIHSAIANSHENEYHQDDYDIVIKSKSKDNRYNILKYKAQEDSSAKLVLIGKLTSISGTDTTVILKADYTNISESVNISNRFLAIIGIVVAALSSFIMFFITRRIVRPILKLSHIAERMARLDFDAKYEGETEDELGELGKSMNFLSEQLKDKISELKRANIELQNDIESKLESDNMRREFLSNISHELKTPIALVQGYAEGLKDNINDDQESREFYCDVIIDEARKMNNMVKKMLDLNHLEFGDATLTIERFDIVALIKGILASTDILFKKKDAKVIFVETAPEYVWADEFLIEEVITNYISNALNHVDGNKIIEIKIIKREDSLRVAVFNTGKNIPEDDIDKIWDKFYKVDKARTREYGGSGVGLSIVKVIIELHKKTCGVVNHDRGVEFWFELDTKVQ